MKGQISRQYFLTGESVRKNSNKSLACGTKSVEWNLLISMGVAEEEVTTGVKSRGILWGFLVDDNMHACLMVVMFIKSNVWLSPKNFSHSLSLSLSPSLFLPPFPFSLPLSLYLPHFPSLLLSLFPSLPLSHSFFPSFFLSFSLVPHSYRFAPFVFSLRLFSFSLLVGDNVDVCFSIVMLIKLDVWHSAKTIFPGIPSISLSFSLTHFLDSSLSLALSLLSLFLSLPCCCSFSPYSFLTSCLSLSQNFPSSLSTQLFFLFLAPCCHNQSNITIMGLASTNLVHRRIN